MLQEISYKDSSGFVNIGDHFVRRYINVSYAPQYDYVMRSGLYQKLVAEGLLIPHTECIPDGLEAKQYHAVIAPEFVSYVSFPYEWPASQWKEVVQSFLKINSISIEYGMILKDATPFNFTFHQGRCVFLDTLSFDFYTEGEPWIAYRQFVEMMLGPLALICFNSSEWPRLLAVNIDGFDLPFISKHLPVRSYFNMTTLFHIHWHSKYRHTKRKGLLQRGYFNRQKLQLLWEMLSDSIGKLKVKAAGSDWQNYYDTAITSEEYTKYKERVVTNWLQELQPDEVIDLGANNGKFAVIASHTAKKVLAVESDHDCMDQLYETIREKEIKNITPIISDITQPTPGVGWNNREHASLLERLNCDCLLALAVVHHLCISKNVPLPFIARLFAGITRKYALVEFVPKSDPKIEAMLANRKDLFDGYTEELFTDAFGNYFILVKKENCICSDRKLFLWKKR
jgi:hypothetical protein